MQPTDIKNPEYFHKVVDCQYACPAHTNVPEYIRLIAQERYTESWYLNWISNVFPGILGRTCDRPCEPACRRTRTHEKPVAICRLKRVAYDNKGDVSGLMPNIPTQKNGKKIALIGAGPASLTVARDLIPMGYEVDMYERDSKAGGMMRSQIPAFRLPEEVIDDEVNQILDFGVNYIPNTEITSMNALLDHEKKYDGIFVGTGAPKGKDLSVPGRDEAPNVHIGIDWLMSVAFGHVSTIGKNVLVIGGGNTAMDCCRTSKRLGADNVYVMVRKDKEDMKASDWEIEEAELEDIPMMIQHSPIDIVIENGKLKGMNFQLVDLAIDANGRKVYTDADKPPVFFAADDIILAIGQENTFPWIERDSSIEFGKWDMPVVDQISFQTSDPRVFFGGDAAFGPENIIWAVAHGHQAAVSIDLLCNGKDVLKDRPPSSMNLMSTKMGIHEWSYDVEINNVLRQSVPHAEKKIALKDISLEVELGFDVQQSKVEADRCLNCDIQTVFKENLCIECDACVDICPMDCINFIFVAPAEEEADLRKNLRVEASNVDQDLYVSDTLKTKRVMVKDEDVCLHCGLCAERCPTEAWDMKKTEYKVTHSYASFDFVGGQQSIGGGNNKEVA